MTILNVIDRRKQPYQFATVNAVIEPTRHDQSVPGADQVVGRTSPNWIGYDEREHLSVAEAFAWAEQHFDAVTLYLYDKDDGIYETRPDSSKSNSTEKS